MANELDKTIEELEAEVLAELEEANGADAPKKGAAPADKADSVSDGKTKVDKGAKPAEVGDASVAAGKGTKEVSNDPAKKGAGKADATPKLKEEEEKDDDDDMSKDSDDSDDADETDEQMTPDKMKETMIKAMKSMKKDDMAELYAQYMKAAMHKTKDEMYKEMQDGMSKMSKDKMEKLHAAYNSEMAHGADDEEKDAKTEERLKSVNVKEHVDALLGADTNLSEEFKVKAATIFETAVKSKIREEIKRLEEEYKSELIEEVADVRTSLTEKVDNYLNYVVEEWMKENELALERGLKGEIAEDFISGLKTLFEDHYIDVPDDKYDILEAQAEKISKLEEKLEATIQQVVESKKAEGFLVQEKVLKDVSSDLTSTEIEKFESLVQDVEFTEETVYAEKLNTLKESYFPKQVISEATDNDVETGTPVQDITEDSSMAAYMSAIGRTVNSAN